ncbi:MAG: L-ascorbate metabolism protein UlaG (beta-lactamase superfamily) [Verrucomicrobiales bacterium]|jgi:L-ascorbate metabolism protein UlaG (beta-lactamase superfamily)
MNLPFLKDDALLTDIRSADEGADHFLIWWLGQSGFLVKWNHQFLLFDPYLSDSLTKKYANSDKPHVRMTELVVDPGKLDFIDVITSSHNHTDHLDAETIAALHAANPDLKLVLPEANMDFARERLGQSTPELLGLDEGKSQLVGDFKFTGIAAAHNEIARDADGRCHYLGFVVEFGPWCIYHSGDTLWHPGLVPALGPFKPTLMLLPINGNRPERRVAGNLNGAEAATLARACNANMVIPCHYDMFEFNTESPDEFANTCERIRQPHQVLVNGERWTSRSIEI